MVLMVWMWGESAHGAGSPYMRCNGIPRPVARLSLANGPFAGRSNA